MAKDSQIKKVANVFNKIWNPIWTLNKPELERMLIAALHGADVRLQACYSQMEQMYPLLHVCIEKRIAGATGREWDVLPIDDKNQQAKEQAEAVEKVLRKSDTRNTDGLTSAISHILLGIFRGRSYVKPFFDEEGNLFFKKLNNWNILQWQNRLYFNPSSEETGWLDQGQLPPNVIEVPGDELCGITVDNPINKSALLLYLYTLVGDSQWARFVEKEGIPQVLITAPEGTPDSALAEWNMRAQALFEGGSGCLPNGSDVKFVTEARGQNPFVDYLNRQSEQLAILCLGGVLLVMSRAAGLGSDLARVQLEQYQSLVNSDCKRVANALSNNVLPKICSKLGYKECLCRFSYVEDAEYSTEDYLNFAKQAQDMGFKIDPKEFKRLTNLSFIAEDDVWSPAKEPSKEWSEKDKAELKKELEDEVTEE